jgi:hypothetical protein
VGNQFYGWYDDATQPADKPSYDPPHDGPCLICGEPISSDDVRTTSLLGLEQYAARCYFYRTHRTCADRHLGAWPDGFIIDMIARNGD